MTGQLEVRSATEADLEAVTAILTSAAEWLRDRGIHQWPTPYPHSSTERAYADGVLRVGVRGPSIVATMRTPRADPDVWGDDPVPALYIHTLASSRDPAARGSGAEMLRWAVRTATADGLAAVRLDCWAENHALRRYYERVGFRHVDDVRQGNGMGYRCSRFEVRCPVR